VKSPRLIPVVILAVAALLVLKTLGLMTSGGYVLGGVGMAQAEETGAGAIDGTVTIPAEPTITDAAPTLDDAAPTLGEGTGDATHAAAPDGADAPSPTANSEHKSGDEALSTGLEAVCPPTDPVAGSEAAPAEAADAAPEGESHDGGDVAAGFATAMTGPDCVELVDAAPSRVGPDGNLVPLVAEDGQAMSEKALLERLTARRTELETYQRELDMRAALVDAAEKKIEERQVTLQALETQISTLVDQRKEMEAGQFTGIITLYENMRPKDAANIFNSLDMDVLLRVAKGMNPRKMSPILAAMDATRAQELTVRMAALADQPPEDITQADLSALPQIVGQ
jgi:flagellar motility protein MotE (MotC chaperone)